MSDFRIRVQAELDATKLTGQLNELKKVPVPIKVKLSVLLLYNSFRASLTLILVPSLALYITSLALYVVAA